MSASPPPSATAPSSKRPLEEPSSPSGPGEQPDAKRPALDKVLKEEAPVASETASETDADAAEPASKTEPTTEAKIEQNGSNGTDSDTVVPDAPTQLTGAEVLTNGNNAAQAQGRQDESNWLHVRAIISSAEAATVIGKGGENVSQIRKLAAARCTVSDYARGAVERILTVSGQVDAVAKVRQRILKLAHNH
jgi:heterogeneous nuclear rnp K-like protein 2